MSDKYHNSGVSSPQASQPERSSRAVEEEIIQQLEALCIAEASGGVVLLEKEITRDIGRQALEQV